ncbi:response regulator [Acidobacteriota bacterium]
MTSPSRKKKVLATDDNRLFRLMLKDMLESSGYEVLLASDGQEALDLIKQHSPEIDLIIVDLLMPKISGFEVIREVRKGALGKEIPILAVTEYYTNPTEIDKVRNTGATGYIRKSSGPEEILFRVNSILKPFPEERRRAVRIPINLPITFEFDGETVTSRTYNIGHDGCFIISRDSPKAGSEINLKFWLPHSSVIINCKGRVAWIRDVEAADADDVPPGFGVALTSIETGAQESLRDFVSSHIQESFIELI